MSVPIFLLPVPGSYFMAILVCLVVFMITGGFMVVILARKITEKDKIFYTYLGMTFIFLVLAGLTMIFGILGIIAVAVYLLGFFSPWFFRIVKKHVLTK